MSCWCSWSPGQRRAIRESICCDDGANVITDFTPGEDFILTYKTPFQFEDYDRVDVEGGSIAYLHGREQIFFEGVAAAEITSDDFIFV